MSMKILSILLIFAAILIAGCTSVQPTVVETIVPTLEPTPVAVPVTLIETPNVTEIVTYTIVATTTPAPTSTNNVDVCYWTNVTDYPTYCYDTFYWVRPTYSPPGSGYSARVWKNDSCVDLNRSSGYCNIWGDGSYVEIFMKNQTIVRNLSNINVTEVVSAAAYYNRTFDLNIINSGDFDSFIKAYWDGSYPSVKYDTTEFAPDLNVVIPIVNGSFNPDGF